LTYLSSTPEIANFVSRPNRFVVTCRLDGRETTAYLPNPGRLSEILLPDTRLWLTRSDNPKRKLAHSVFAAEHEGERICLDTHLANRIAADLINSDRVPGLEGARVVASEVRSGHSRFDLVILHRGRKRWVEVKSCTMFGNRVAAFPDAVTSRGRRHLTELAALSAAGNRPIVLFIIHTQQVDFFYPDYHTDLAFSLSFLEHRHALEILPIAITWDKCGRIVAPPSRLVVPWEYLKQEVSDQGGYLMLLQLSKTRQISVGKLRNWVAQPGWYVYVGSAMRALSTRLERHARLRKKMHWHIDYLRAAADRVIPLAIRSSRREECDIATAMSHILSPGLKGFGSSDCDCPTHLYFSSNNPMENRFFHEAVQSFRLRPPTN